MLQWAQKSATVDMSRQINSLNTCWMNNIWASFTGMLLCHRTAASLWTLSYSLTLSVLTYSLCQKTSNQREFNCSQLPVIYCKLNRIQNEMQRFKAGFTDWGQRRSLLAVFSPSHWQQPFKRRQHHHLMKVHTQNRRDVTKTEQL